MAMVGAGPAFGAWVLSTCAMSAWEIVRNNPAHAQMRNAEQEKGVWS
jgi:hypothetical protein